MRFLTFYSLVFSLFILISGGSLAYARTQEPDIVCLATAIYHESRGESEQGQIAVAYTVLNRSKSEKFPNSICDVVYQDRQFTDIKTARPDLSSQQWTKAIKLAILAKLNVVSDPTRGSMWYYAHNKIPRPHWAKNMRTAAQIGNHTFLEKK